MKKITLILLNLKNTFLSLFFRFADRFISPNRFLKHVPSKEQLTLFSGRLSLEIVSHCWNYSHLMAYNLSSYVNYPPTDIDITVTVFYSNEDKDTIAMLEYFGSMDIPNVTWNWQALETNQLLRRAIGRNKAALNTKANWIWYTDCDLIFHQGCLDSLAKQLSNNNNLLLFPEYESVTALLDDKDSIIQNKNKLQLIDIDTDIFHKSTVSRAVGPYQITHGDVARACGYCNDIKIYQTPEEHWRKTYEDRTYRWLLRTQGTPIDIPAIYRIRHRSKGRYQKGALLSSIRQNIRVLKANIAKILPHK